MRHFQRQPLTVSETCESDCGLCATLGCLRPSTLDWFSFERELALLELCSPREIVLPPNAIDHPDVISMVREIRSRGIGAVVRIRPRQWESKQEIVSSLEYRGAEFELLIDRPMDERTLRFVSSLAGRISSSVLVLSRALDAEAIVESLPPSIVDGLALLAPVGPSERFFSPDEVFRLRTNEKIRDLPSAGFMQGRSRFIETGVHAKIRHASRSPFPNRVKVSIVVPFRTGIGNLRRGLDAIATQDFDPHEYELVVVCDRADDSDVQSIREWMAIRDFPTMLLELDTIGTKRADFRAGQARNAGTYHASGDLLVFLDADALPPKEFLKDVTEAHLRSDVVQYKRLEENREQEEYWTRFYSQGDWMVLPDRWKYVSTFALSVKLSDFLEAGGFTPIFDRYGCEDTLLGWALDQMGRRFELRELSVLHVGGRVRLRPESTRMKMKKIAPSARSMYLATLDENVYRVFFSVMGRFPGLRKLTRALIGSPA